MDTPLKIVRYDNDLENKRKEKLAQVFDRMCEVFLTVQPVMMPLFAERIAQIYELLEDVD